MKTVARILMLLVAVGGWRAAVEASPGAEGERVSGWFAVTWGDPVPATGGVPRMTFTLTDDTLQSLELLIDDETARRAGGVLALDRRRVIVEGMEAAGEGRASVARPALRVTAIALAPDRGLEVPGAEAEAALTGSQPWVSVLCRFSDVSAEPKTLNFFQGMYGSIEPGLDHYWRELSFDQVNVNGSNAFGWHALPQPRAYYVYDKNGDGQVEADLTRLFTDCTAAADPYIYYPAYQGINLMFNADLDCCAWGGARYATLDGVSKVWNTTWEPTWGYANVAVIAHEMGHGFGLPHSSGRYGSTYDNPWDVMSDIWANCSTNSDPVYGCKGQHTIAYHKERLGWITPAQRATVSAGTKATLTLAHVAAPAGYGYQAARIPLGTSALFYTVEARQRVGYDRKLNGDAVIIHEVDEGRSRPAQVIDADGNVNNGDAGAMWLPGETFVGKGGITVTVDGTTATGFQVTIANPVTVYTLSVTVTGSGSVTSSPAGINCPATACSANFPRGAVVALTASPTGGSSFAGWGGACTGAGTCTVTMNATRSVTATFTAIGNPTVEILSPTVGEHWVGGTSHQISWTAANLPAGGQFQLFHGDESGWVFVASVTGTARSYTWVVPRIKVANCAVFVGYVMNGNWVATDAHAISIEIARRTGRDFDGDGRVDPTVWRAGPGVWYSLPSSTNYTTSQMLQLQWGAAQYGDIPVPGDYDGDGKTDPAVWRASVGMWYVLRSSKNYSTSDSLAVQYGGSAYGDVPVPADYDGDGKTDPAVWRANVGMWYVLRSSKNYSTSDSLAVQYGGSGYGDVPVPADYDGDGKADPAVWRASAGMWYALRSSKNYSTSDSLAVQWGGSTYGDVPVVGDYDGDGKADPAVWRAGSGVWFVLKSTAGYAPAQHLAIQWGGSAYGDKPMPGDYDGDGMTDPAVWRAGPGVWFALTSSGNYSRSNYFAVQWGAEQYGDLPQ